MAKTKKQTEQERTAGLKSEFLRFFAELPIQKAGADFIGVDEDTITNWKKSDTDFRTAVSRAKSEWARRASKRVKPDNLLANLYDETKPPKQEVEMSTPTAITINHVHTRDNNQTDEQAG